MEEDDSRELRYRAVTTPAGKRRMRNMAAYSQLYERYAGCIELSNKIIKRIDVLYKTAE
jgi:hypothetical protein